jgi:ubiquinone/menaquinone biosynthesis C-methylase UbiE
MDEPEFDKFANEYYAMHAAGISMSGEGPEYFAEYKIRDIAREYEQHFPIVDSPVKILDFGAGIGGSIPYVRKHFASAQLTCLDLSRRSLEIAEKRFPSLAEYVHFDGSSIPFPSEHFDIAYAMCVFHHIDHAEHISLLKELRRVIRPGGSLFIFEHNPYNPLTVRVVNNCPFDENARLIRGADMQRRLMAAGFASAKIRYRIFFPNILRALRSLEMVLTWLPFGGQYYVLSRK